VSVPSSLYTIRLIVALDLADKIEGEKANLKFSPTTST